MVPFKIYLAEDDLDDRELFMDALGEVPLNTEVTQFDNGVDLMDNLFSDSPLPDVIFLDLYMPIMDGFACLADIRSFSRFRDIKVIVYSTSYVEREVDQLKADGANKYIQKPNSFNQLKTLLYKSLKQMDGDMEGKRQGTDFVVLV